MSEAWSQPSSVPSIRTHLVLVHDQLIPNIIPALDERFRPCRVCLLHSPHFQSQADRLCVILQDSGVGVERWHLDDPWDLDHIRQRVSDFVTDPGHGEISLNISGGTIPMSLAAFEVFRAAQQSIYYVHPERDHVVWLTPRDTPSFDLADRIRLPAFLRARDFRLIDLKRQGIAEGLRDMTALLVRKISTLAPSLSVLNWYAAAAGERNGLTSPVIHNKHLQSPEFLQLIELFSAQHLLRVTAEQRIVFSDPQARFYVNGGWLEEHVFGVVSRLRRELPTIQDLARNVEIEWDDQGSAVSNELDVVFLADNRLYLIECKTKKFEKDPSAESNLAETLYKLYTLCQSLGGKNGRAMLVSYTGLKKPHRQRAEELGIEVCEGDNIRNLDRLINKWIGGGTL